MYPIDGAGIPRLYVIRADGEMLYGAVGSLSGDKLPQMMVTTWQQAGRSFNDAEAGLLASSVSEAQSMLDAGNLLGAAVALSGVARFGSPDDLGSFAKPAISAGELYQQIQSAIDGKVSEAETQLAETTSKVEPLDALLVICEAEASYKLFPKLKSKAGIITRDVKKQASYADAFAQADSLVKARVLKSSTNPRLRSRAPAAYTSVIRRYPGTRVDELARAELAEIQPEAKILESQSEPEMTAPPTKFRKWTARSGNFSTTAKYVQQKSGKVQLLKEDGEKIVVDISALSEEDKAFLKAQL